MDGNLSRTAFENSPQSPRFRHSVHEIPTPGLDGEETRCYEPFILNTWIIGGISLLMICLGIGIEVALHLSNVSNGFAVPSANIFSFVSTQFLTSFFPTLLIAPLAFFWNVSDWMLRWYQPYVTLSEGKAPASRSILLDYIALNRISVLFYSLKHGHSLIIISTLIALTVIFMQPLAGSLLQVKQVSHTSDASALSTRILSLSPYIDQLQAFEASSGFVDAAVFSDLEDPPFVQGTWTAAQFETAPGSYLNGTLTVNTTGIETHVNCVNPTFLNLTALSPAGDYVVDAVFPGNCSTPQTSSFALSSGSEQYGVVNASNCSPAGLGISYQPVVFWFYLMDNTTNGQLRVAPVFCQPTMELYVIQTAMDLNNGLLASCSVLYDDDSSNNVTGSLPYNGVVFDPSDDAYVTTRGVSIGAVVPNTIYRYATQQLNGLLSVFDDPNGFLDITTTIYTQHLAVAALANYFGPTNTTIPALLTADISRLFVEALPAHALCVLMIVIGSTGFIVHLLHKRSRRNLRLTSPPGSIAAIVSLTSRSGFGELLLPYDDEERMQQNLTGLTFRLDRRTGAIVAEEGSGNLAASDKTMLLGSSRAYHGVTVGMDSLSPLSRMSFREKQENV